MPHQLEGGAVPLLAPPSEHTPDTICDWPVNKVRKILLEKVEFLGKPLRTDVARYFCAREVTGTDTQQAGVLPPQPNRLIPPLREDLHLICISCQGWCSPVSDQAEVHVRFSILYNPTLPAQGE